MPGHGREATGARGGRRPMRGGGRRPVREGGRCRRGRETARFFWWDRVEPGVFCFGFRGGLVSFCRTDSDPIRGTGILYI